MEAQPSSSSATTAAVTDEELDAFLATRPWRDRLDSAATAPPMSDDEQDRMMSRMLSDPAWSTGGLLGFQPLDNTTSTPSSHSQQATLLPPALPPTSSSSDMEWESREPTFSDPRKFVYASPSSFEAQFFEGTPEQDALLQALADQQQQRDHEQEQQQNFEQQQQRYRQHLLQAYDVPPSQTASTQYTSQTPTSDVFMQQSSLPVDYSQYSSLRNQLSPSLVQQSTHSSSTPFHWRETTAGPPIHSPNSDVFSSPELVVHRSTQTQYGSTRPASPPTLQQHPSLSMASSSSHLSPSSSASAFANLSPTDMRQARRSSTEIRALQQRRQVRRTYAGPSPSASLLDVSNSGRSVADATADGRSRARLRAARPLSSSGTNFLVETTKHPARNDGVHMSASYSSEESSRFNDTYSITSTPPPHAGPQRQGDHAGASLPTSLSAELAGLGIDPDNFYGSRQGDVFMDNDESESQSYGHVFDTSGHQTSSSSSASTTQRHQAMTGDSSLFSQNTTFSSSGLDESLQSHDSGAAASSSGGQGNTDSSSGALGQIHSSRWVHGRDTPPSTPSRGSLGPSPSSIAEASVAIAKPASMRVSEKTQQQGQSAADSRSSPYPRTWPRTAGEGTNVAALRAVASAGSSKLPSPVESSGSGVGVDAAITHVRSPAHAAAARGDAIGARVATHTRPRRTPSSASSSSSSFLSHFDGQSARQTTRLPIATDAGHQHATEGLSSRSEARSKRWSSVILTTPSASSQHDAHVAARRRRAATGRLPQPEQYEQVSAALETLRTFLRQRERPAQQQQQQQQQEQQAAAASAATTFGATPRRVVSNRSMPFSGAASVPQTPPAQWSGGGGMRADAMFDSSSAVSTSPSAQSVLSSSDAVRIPSSLGAHSMHSGSSTMTPGRGRTLRHPPAGPLPPRGSLQTRSTPVQASPTGSNTTLDVGHSIHRSSDSDGGWRSLQSRGSSASNTAGWQQQQPPPRPRHRHTPSSASMDRIAALDDLSERVRRMRDEEQQRQQQSR